MGSGKGETPKVEQPPKAAATARAAVKDRAARRRLGRHGAVSDRFMKVRMAIGTYSHL